MKNRIMLSLFKLSYLLVHFTHMLYLNLKEKYYVIFDYVSYLICDLLAL